MPLYEAAPDIWKCWVLGIPRLTDCDIFADDGLMKKMSSSCLQQVTAMFSVLSSSSLQSSSYDLSHDSSRYVDFHKLTVATAKPTALEVSSSLSAGLSLKESDEDVTRWQRVVSLVTLSSQMLQTVQLARSDSTLRPGQRRYILCETLLWAEQCYWTLPASSDEKTKI